MDKSLLKIYSFIIISLIAVVLLCPFILPNTSMFSNNIITVLKNYFQKHESEECITIPDKSKGSVTIIMDDGFESQYTNGYMIMEKYGYKGCVAAIPTRVGEYNYMDLKQLSALYSKGWDILNHTYDHMNLSELNYRQQVIQIVGGKLWLKIHGFKYSDDILIFPGGINNEETFDILNKYGFRAARSLCNIWTLSPNTRLGDVIICNLTDEIASEEAISLIDKIIKDKSHAIFIFHKIENGYDCYHMRYSVDEFEKIIEYINEKKDVIEVLNLSEMISIYE